MKNKDNYKYELKQSIKGTVTFFLYFILSNIAGLPLYLIGIDYSKLSIHAKEIYLIIHCITMMLIFFLIYKDELIKGFNDLKKNYKEYFKKYIKYWFFAIAIMYISNYAILYLKYKSTGEISIAANEQGIRDTMKLATTYVLFAASLYAPFIEELTFRHSLRKVFKNKYLFLIISSFVFGGLHVFNSGMSLPFDLLYLIPYCAPGVALAYIYLKTDNITTTISIHMIHNTLLMLLQLFFMSRGLI